MTVNSLTNRSGAFYGNGVTTVFSYGFKIFAASELRVVKSVSGVEANAIINVEYSITGVGNNAGGTVIFITPPPTGTTIYIVREVEFSQTTDLQNQGAYYAETIEDSLDKITMMAQQIKEISDRSFKSSFSSTGYTMSGSFSDGQTFVISGDKVVPGPNATQITNAQGYAQSAQASAQAAATFNPNNFYLKTEPPQFLDWVFVKARAPGSGGNNNSHFALQNVSGGTVGLLAYDSILNRVRLADTRAPKSLSIDAATGEHYIGGDVVLHTGNTPKTMAFLNFSGNSMVIRNSQNIASITRYGPGDYGIAFLNAIPTHYGVFGTASGNATHPVAALSQNYNGVQTTGGVGVLTGRTGGSGANGFLADCEWISVQIVKY